MLQGAKTLPLHLHTSRLWFPLLSSCNTEKSWTISPNRCSSLSYLSFLLNHYNIKLHYAKHCHCLSTRQVHDLHFSLTVRSLKVLSTIIKQSLFLPLSSFSPWLSHYKVTGRQTLSLQLLLTSSLWLTLLGFNNGMNLKRTILYHSTLAFSPLVFPLHLKITLRSYETLNNATVSPQVTSIFGFVAFGQMLRVTKVQLEAPWQAD